MTLEEPFDLEALLGIDDEPAPMSGGGGDGSRKPIILWLVVCSLAILFLPLTRIAATVKAENSGMAEELTSIQTTLESETVQLPEVEELESSASDFESKVVEIEEIYTELAANHFDWSEGMSAIANYNSTELVLHSLSQSGNRIVLSGQARDENVVITYATQLEQSAQFSRATVQSLTSLPTPTPLPTSTPTPTPTPSPTPTPELETEEEDAGEQPVESASLSGSTSTLKHLSPETQSPTIFLVEFEILIELTVEIP